LSTLTAVRKRTTRSTPVRIGARVGLAARGIVWILMGVLAIEVAVGGTQRQADQQGALAAIASHTGGKVLIVLIAAGLASYALWRLSQAVFGTSPHGKEVKNRLTAAFRGVMYAILCYTAVTVVAGSSGSTEDQQQRGYTARLMDHTGGRWLVGIVGLVVIAVGGYFAQQGIRRDIYGHLKARDVPERIRTPVVVLGVIGNTLRGVVIGLVGVLVLVAAITADPHKSSGLDGALRSVAHQPFGPYLLVVLGLGLIAFGLFGIAEGVWSKV
jgi:hypothetical protein